MIEKVEQVIVGTLGLDIKIFYLEGNGEKIPTRIVVWSDDVIVASDEIVDPEILKEEMGND